MCLSQLKLESLRFIDLKKIFWINISTNPNPNSIAESTKKKNVNDNKFILSKKVPQHKTNKYKVIHSISAVKSKWIAVVTLVTILEKIIKKIII